MNAKIRHDHAIVRMAARQSQRRIASVPRDSVGPGLHYIGLALHAIVRACNAVNPLAPIVRHHVQVHHDIVAMRRRGRFMRIPLRLF